jgi:hypothetical protein
VVFEIEDRVGAGSIQLHGKDFNTS